MQYVKSEIYNLVTQFQEAYNIRNFNWTSEIYHSLFLEWLEERTEIRRKYTELLDECGIDFRTPNVVEIGKSVFDSIALRDNNTSIITLYSKDVMEQSNNDARVIYSGKLRVYKNYDLITAGLGKMIINTPFDCYMTQNPYEETELMNWQYLNNRGKNLIVGVYGSIKDHDLIKKVEMVESLIYKLDENKFITAIDSSNEYYALAVSTKKPRQRK